MVAGRRRARRRGGAPTRRCRRRCSQVVEGAVRNGLYPRPWKRSLMFAPPANRSRALFTLTVRDDDRVDLCVRRRGLPDLLRARAGRGRAAARAGGPDDARRPPRSPRFADRLDELMADAEAVTDGGKPRPHWNGRDFYVTIGDRSWEDAERYGFVSAGGGDVLHEAAREALPRRARLPLQALPGQGLRRRRHRQGEGAAGDRVRGRGRRAEACRSSRRRWPTRRRSPTTPTTPSSASTSSASNG